MIEFSHVSKLFGAQKAVNDLNLNFQEGSFSVLIGTSGSGKSSTGSERISSPAKRITPLSCSTRRLIIFRVVDLPEPDVPISTEKLPSCRPDPGI